MKVGVIASEMEGLRTGVGRYLEGLLGGLERWDHGSEWHLFFAGEPGDKPPSRDPRVVCHHARTGGSTVAWEHLRLPAELARHDLDVVFGPAYSLPPRLRSPSVVTVHDLSFELLPREFGFRERWRRRLAARWSVRRADRVLADTSAMARKVAARYRLPADAVGVVPLAVDGERFSPRPAPDDERLVAALGAREPYLLWVGTVLERRLPREVLAAFAELRSLRPELQLVIAGVDRMRDPSRLGSWVRSIGLEGSVLAAGWVDEAALAPLYRRAELGFYLSRHEGFGIPPLECLACGTPVVASDGLALDELWPDYPFRCADPTPAAIAELAGRILADPQRARALFARAGEVLGALDWETSSRRLLAELELAARP